MSRPSRTCRARSAARPGTRARRAGARTGARRPAADRRASARAPSAAARDRLAAATQRSASSTVPSSISTGRSRSCTSSVVSGRTRCIRRANTRWRASSRGEASYTTQPCPMLPVTHPVCRAVRNRTTQNSWSPRHSSSGDRHGMRPASPGWFVLNARDAEWQDGPFGAYTPFENTEQRFAELGINVAVLRPGQPNAYYHAENVEENFLVLDGECLLIVEEQERRLRALGLRALPAAHPAHLRRRRRTAVPAARRRQPRPRRPLGALSRLRSGAAPRRRGRP